MVAITRSIFIVVYNVVASYVVYLSSESNFFYCYSQFTLQIYFFTQEIFKFARVLSLKTFIDADEARVIVKELHGRKNWNSPQS